MPFEIRDARPSDARRLEEIRIAGWKTAYVGLIDADHLATLAVTEERLAAWEARIASPAVTLAAERDGDVIGFAVLMDSRDEDLPDAAELVALYVDAARQSGGVGTALLTAGFERMPQAAQSLWVLEGNTAARRFYERHGFSADGARKARTDIVGAPVEVRYRRSRLG